ncbi:MAG: VanZ family protein [Actinomadura sp.]
MTCLGVFSYWAARITFTPVHDHGQAVGNIEIGHSLRFYLDQPNVKEAIQQIGGNLALLAPLGILLPTVFPALRPLPRIAAASALVSLVIEIAQGTLIAGRAFDIDDVILNVIGVLAAYLLAGRMIATLVRGHPST